MSTEADTASTISFYNRISNWCREQKGQQPGAPLLIGINGAQGIGKTTLTRYLVDNLQSRGLSALTISIDDFYLTHADQKKLAQKYPTNTYLQQRGYPGTHDIKLGLETLNNLKKNQVQNLKIPSYEKSAFDGLGDRVPEAHWVSIKAPFDIIFLEGWMLGFKTIDQDQLPCEEFEVINQFLQAYHTWTELLDAFIFLDASSFDYTLTWRVEAEANMKKSGKAGLSEEAIRNYIAKFTLAYKTYVPELRRSLLGEVPTLHLEIGKDRQPTN